MPKLRMINTAIMLPKELLSRAKTKAELKHGERSFSKYVRSLIAADLAKK